MATLKFSNEYTLKMSGDVGGLAAAATVDLTEVPYGFVIVGGYISAGAGTTSNAVGVGFATGTALEMMAALDNSAAAVSEVVEAGAHGLASVRTDAEPLGNIVRLTNTGAATMAASPVLVDVVLTGYYDYT